MTFSTSRIPLVSAIALFAVIALPLPAQKHPAPMNNRRPSSHPPRQPKQERQPKPDRPLERLQRMSPAERSKALDRLPPERRRALEDRLQRLDRLSPEQKARFDRFRDLPPDRQSAVRRAAGSVASLPPDRQKAVRQELRKMQDMPAADRDARMRSPDFKGKFNANEQDLIKDLREVMPHQPLD